MKQERTDSPKLYSIHAPEVECIAKEKAHKKYDFGNKVSVVSLSRVEFVIGMKAFHGNPFDGHTLQKSMEQAERISGRSLSGEVFVDRGYRGHDYTEMATIQIAGMKKLSKRMRQSMRRRSTIEAKIGHMKGSSRLDRNYLLGKEGDAINALMCGSGVNLRLLMRAIYQCLSFGLDWVVAQVERIHFRSSELWSLARV